MPISSFGAASSIIKSGVCTSTTRPASPFDGQMVYETDTDRVAVYDSSAWVYKTNAVAPALTLVKSQTIGSAVSSVTVTNAFSSTYDNYKVTIVGGAGSSSTTEFNLKLGASTTGYYSNLVYTSYNTTVQAVAANNGGAWTYLGGTSTSGLYLDVDLFGPFLSKFTFMRSNCVRTDIAGSTNGIHQVATSYADLVITLGAAITITGGEIRVYGYQNS